METGDSIVIAATATPPRTTQQTASKITTLVFFFMSIQPLSFLFIHIEPTENQSQAMPKRSCHDKKAATVLFCWSENYRP